MLLFISVIFMGFHMPLSNDKQKPNLSVNEKLTMMMLNQKDVMQHQRSDSFDIIKQIKRIQIKTKKYKCCFFSHLQVLTDEGFGAITTEIAEAKEFYYAEDYHQQYLSKDPNGYCGLAGTGVSCPIGVRKQIGLTGLLLERVALIKHRKTVQRSRIKVKALYNFLKGENQ